MISRTYKSSILAVGLHSFIPQPLILFSKKYLEWNAWRRHFPKNTPWLVMICCPGNDLGLMDIEEARPTSDVFVWLPICSLQNGTHVPTMKNSWYLKKPT
jgi:hypothetical protein